LLKLGFTVSERTVSRYLPNRLRASSQTWRTFLANHVGDLVLSSTLTSCDAVSGDGGSGDGYVVSFGCAPTYLRRRTRPGSSKDPPPLFRRRDGPQRGRASGYSIPRAHQEAGHDSFGGNWFTASSGFLCKYLQSGRQRHLMASCCPRNAVSERLSRRSGSEYWRDTTGARFGNVRPVVDLERPFLTTGSVKIGESSQRVHQPRQTDSSVGTGCAQQLNDSRGT
jgi:hypothetical protein